MFLLHSEHAMYFAGGGGVTRRGGFQPLVVNSVSRHGQHPTLLEWTGNRGVKIHPATKQDKILLGTTEHATRPRPGNDSACWLGVHAHESR